MKLEEYHYKDSKLKFLIKQLHDVIELGNKKIGLPPAQFDWLKNELQQTGEELEYQTAIIYKIKNKSQG